MAAPMRSGHQQDGQGHRARVADSCKGATAARGPNQQPTAGQPHQHQQNQPTTATAANFEYDDNEWDIGIGDLIIDLDADIEKTNEQQQPIGGSAMAANAGSGPQASKAAATAKMHIEHSATADKGLKMKIKRTKPGTKTSEAKHEIVKSNELNGAVDPSDLTKGPQGGPGGNKHLPASTGTAQPNAGNALAGGGGQNLSATGPNASPGPGGANKRGSSGHRRDKASRDKHADRNVHNLSASSGPTGPSSQPTSGSSSSSTSSSSSSSSGDKLPPKSTSATGGTAAAQIPTSFSGAIASSTDMNGLLLRAASAPQPGPPRSVFPASTGPGPPPPSPGPPASPAAATAQGSAAKPEQSKVGGVVVGGVNSGVAGVASAGQSGGNAVTVAGQDDHRTNSTSPPPSKKAKTDSKDTADVCVGTSVGTITEPDCLGPCEPGTSVTLEGIVWHETEGGVLVVNVTWRGKTYVGTLLDCTRHDWAPPRFCDSPTSDLDNRTPKGRETRSSVHSKLRNGGGPKGGRRGVANGAGPANAPSPPVPFVPPRPDNKRKGRAGEEETSSATSAPSNGKKAKIVVPPVPTAPTAPLLPPVAPAAAAAAVTCGSPPPSPVLLECPEPNCSKKYKHINGLKYHQSHAHGSIAEDEDTKDVTSMSENDESNIEAPSPVTPVKSPDKSQDSPPTPPVAKKESITAENQIPSLISTAPESASTPPSPATPPSIVHDIPPLPAAVAVSAISSPSVPMVEVPQVKPQAVVKPAILRFGGSQEDYAAPPVVPSGGGVGVFGHGGKPQIQGPPISNTGQLISGRSSAPGAVPTDQGGMQQPENVPPPQSFTNQLQSHVNMSPQQFSQPTNIIIPNQNPSNPQMQSQLSPLHPPPSPTQTAKLAQFKVKPTSALMPEEKKTQLMPQPPQPQQHGSNLQKSSSFKKKNRKSPAGSPHPTPADQPVFGLEQSGRDEVQSPAYSDISDDGAPVGMDAEVDKSKNPDKKTESGQALPHMGQYGIYPFYSPTHQYVVPNQQQQQLETQPSKPKEPEKPVEKIVVEKEIKKETPEYPSKMLQQHYYPYGYMPPGYPYNMEPNYGSVPMPQQDDKHKEDNRVKESPSPIEQPVNKAPVPIPNPIQVPMPSKPKQQPEPIIKDKHQNDNHQIIKESIEIKNQMNPYMYSRQPPQQQPPQQQVPQHHGHREEEARRYYVYEQQRRKEQQQQQQQQQHQQQGGNDHGKSNNSNLGKMSVSQSPSMKTKEVKLEEKKEKEVKQEGVKPTMETQGPPPPPTSQYAYIHPSYMQSAHYGALPFDPNHPMYRGIMVPGPYSNSPYLHPQMPRYHAPEDLSRAQPPTKALDMLQHHAQYYSSHKIHELQERAIKSPTPKTSVASSSPSTNNPPPSSGQSPAQMSAPPTTQASGTTPSNGKQTPGGGDKDSRSPPPQRHVHTHHHTHVGLGYPMYPAPYGAAVLASQQAAAVTVINPYPTK